MFRKLASMIMASSFVIVWVAVATGEDKPSVQKSTGTVQQAKPVKLAKNPCPQGWHVIPGSMELEGKRFMCAPNNPTTIKSAPKFQYVEKDCAVGCQPIIY